MNKTEKVLDSMRRFHRLVNELVHDINDKPMTTKQGRGILKWSGKVILRMQHLNRDLNNMKLQVIRDLR